MSIDGQGQPLNKSYNWFRNKDKALYSLKGLLRGYTADNRLTDLELLHLNDWLQAQVTLKNDPDVIDLQDCINRILADGHISSDELEEMYDLIDSVITYRFLDIPEISGKINKLLGLLEGVSADDNINEVEANKIQSWINENQDILDAWPAQILSEELNKLNADGVFDSEDLAILLSMVKKITGVDFAESGQAGGGSSKIHIEAGHSVIFENMRFVLTGNFDAHPRSLLEERIAACGGLIQDGVTKKLNYLVIGSKGSRDWKHASYGNKYDKAVELRNSGVPIIFISEVLLEIQIKKY